MSFKSCGIIKVETHIGTWKFLFGNRFECLLFVAEHLQIMLKLALAQKFVVLLSALAVGCAVWIHKYLYLVLMRKSFQLIKAVVPVIVENYQLIVLFQLRKKSVSVLYLLHRGGYERITGIILSYVILQHGNIHDYLVKTVFRNSRNHVAEWVGKMYLLYKRICKGISYGNTP